MFGVHGFLILALGVHHLSSSTPKKKKMVVRNFQEKKPALVKSPPANQNISKKVVKRKVSPPKKPKKEKTEQLVKEMRKQIASIEEEKVLEPKKSIDLPKEVVLEKKEETFFYDPDYKEKLLLYLQESLILPEKGDVLVDLTLSKYGRVIRFEILSAESEKNAEHLKNNLPELYLPCFNDESRSYESVQYTVTFKSLDSSW